MVKRLPGLSNIVISEQPVRSMVTILGDEVLFLPIVPGQQNIMPCPQIIPGPGGFLNLEGFFNDYRVAACNQRFKHSQIASHAHLGFQALHSLVNVTG